VSSHPLLIDDDEQEAATQAILLALFAAWGLCLLVWGRDLVVFYRRRSTYYSSVQAARKLLVVDDILSRIGRVSPKPAAPSTPWRGPQREWREMQLDNDESGQDVRVSVSELYSKTPQRSGLTRQRSTSASRVFDAVDELGYTEARKEVERHLQGHYRILSSWATALRKDHAALSVLVDTCWKRSDTKLHRGVILLAKILTFLFLCCAVSPPDYFCETWKGQPDVLPALLVREGAYVRFPDLSTRPVTWAGVVDGARALVRVWTSDQIIGLLFLMLWMLPILLLLSVDHYLGSAYHTQRLAMEERLFEADFDNLTCPERAKTTRDTEVTLELLRALQTLLHEWLYSLRQLTPSSWNPISPRAHGPSGEQTVVLSSEELQMTRDRITGYIDVLNTLIRGFTLRHHLLHGALSCQFQTHVLDHELGEADDAVQDEQGIPPRATDQQTRIGPPARDERANQSSFQRQDSLMWELLPQRLAAQLKSRASMRARLTGLEICGQPVPCISWFLRALKSLAFDAYTGGITFETHSITMKDTDAYTLSYVRPRTLRAMRRLSISLLVVYAASLSGYIVLFALDVKDRLLEQNILLAVLSCLLIDGILLVPIYLLFARSFIPGLASLLLARDLGVGLSCCSTRPADNHAASALQGSKRTRSLKQDAIVIGDEEAGVEFGNVNPMLHGGSESGTGTRSPRRRSLPEQERERRRERQRELQREKRTEKQMQTALSIAPRLVRPEAAPRPVAVRFKRVVVQNQRYLRIRLCGLPFLVLVRLCEWRKIRIPRMLRELYSDYDGTTFALANLEGCKRTQLCETIDAMFMPEERDLTSVQKRASNLQDVKQIKEAARELRRQLNRSFLPKKKSSQHVAEGGKKLLSRNHPHSSSPVQGDTQNGAAADDDDDDEHNEMSESFLPITVYETFATQWYMAKVRKSLAVLGLVRQFGCAQTGDQTYIPLENVRDSMNLDQFAKQLMALLCSEDASPTFPPSGDAAHREKAPLPRRSFFSRGNVDFSRSMHEDKAQISDDSHATLACGTACICVESQVPLVTALLCEYHGLPTPASLQNFLARPALLCTAIAMHYTCSHMAARTIIARVCLGDPVQEAVQATTWHHAELSETDHTHVVALVQLAADCQSLIPQLKLRLRCDVEMKIELVVSHILESLGKHILRQADQGVLGRTTQRQRVAQEEGDAVSLASPDLCVNRGTRLLVDLRPIFAAHGGHTLAARTRAQRWLSDCTTYLAEKCGVPIQLRMLYVHRVSDVYHESDILCSQSMWRQGASLASGLTKSAALLIRSANVGDRCKRVIDGVAGVDHDALLHVAASRIQAQMRLLFAQAEAESMFMEHIIVQVQAHARGFLVRARMANMVEDEFAVSIQSAFRGHRSRTGGRTTGPRL